MGALLYSNETYRETLPVIDASGVTSFPFAYTSPVWLYDWRTGDTEELSLPLSELTSHALFQKEIKKYIKFWNTVFAPMASIGYKARARYFYGVVTMLMSLLGIEWCSWVHNVNFRLAS